MLKKLPFLFFLALSIFSQTYSEEFISKSGKLISLMPCQMEDLDECQGIFVNAFLLAYANFTPEELGIQDKTIFLKDAFSDVYDDFQIGEQKLFIAKYQEKLIGFVGFKKAEKPHQIYITQLAVDPNYWRQGIGKHLVFSAFNAFDHASSLVVICRKINEVAINFYQKLGFVSSSYLHPEYSAEKYIGYEWSIDRL